MAVFTSLGATLANLKAGIADHFLTIGETISMSNGPIPNPLPGHAENFAQIYETLKLQQKMLNELSVDTAALVHVLRASPELSGAFDEERTRLFSELSERHAAVLRLLDEAIARLRRT